MSHMMVAKNPQNVHRKCFWTILVTFIFDVKIDVNMCEPHYVNYFFLWTSSIVCVFDFLTFDIFLTFWHLFDILTSFNLNHLSLSQGYFFSFLKLHLALCHEWHVQSKCMPSMPECCPIFFFSFFKAFIQTKNYWHLYKKLAGIYTRKKTCWHLYKRVSSDSLSLGGLHLYKLKSPQHLYNIWQFG